MENVDEEERGEAMTQKAEMDMAVVTLARAEWQGEER